MINTNEEQPSISTPSATCSNCTSAMASQEIYCSNCGFPENGTEQERVNFRAKIGTKKRLLKIVQKEIKKAKNTLAFLGILNAAIGLYFGFVLEDVATAVVLIIVSLIYLGLRIWTDKQPFGAILTALILYGTMILLDAVVDPTTIFQGIIVKVIIIGFLIKGLKSGSEAKAVMKELEELGVKNE